MWNLQLPEGRHFKKHQHLLLVVYYQILFLFQTNIENSFEIGNLLQIVKFLANSCQRHLNLEMKLSSEKLSNFEVSIMILLQKKDPEIVLHWSLKLWQFKSWKVAAPSVNKCLTTLKMRIIFLSIFFSWNNLLFLCCPGPICCNRMQFSLSWTKTGSNIKL